MHMRVKFSLSKRSTTELAHLCVAVEAELKCSLESFSGEFCRIHRKKVFNFVQKQTPTQVIFSHTLRDKWRFFWSVFSRIQTEYGDLQSTSPYSVQIRENTYQKKLHIQAFYAVIFQTIFRRLYPADCFWSMKVFTFPLFKISHNEFLLFVPKISQ